MSKLIQEKLFKDADKRFWNAVNKEKELRKKLSSKRGESGDKQVSVLFSR